MAAYHSASWRGKLDLTRHAITINVDRSDDIYEFLHIVLDDRIELDYSVNKAAAIDDDHSMRGFARLMFALGEGETKTFKWVTSHGVKDWILSRDTMAVYVYIPELEYGLFVRYWKFRDGCFAAYEKAYGWGYRSDIQRIEVPERDLESLTWLEPEDEFELVRYLDDGRSFETTDIDRLLRFVDEGRLREKTSEDPDPECIQRFTDLYESIMHYITEQKP